jgi:hypothetical protein
LSRPVYISPVDEHDVAHFQRAHLRFRQRRGQHHFAPRQREARAARHALHGPRGIAIQPFGDRARRRVEAHTQPAKRPAFIRHGNEETGGQAVHRANLATDQRRFSAEAHRADAELVRLFHDLGFQFREHRVGIYIVERSKQLSLGQIVAVRAVAADAHADGARRASLPLRLPHGVQDALAHALQIAVGAAHVIERAGHGILDVLVLAAAALEDQFYFNVVFFPLLEMNDRRFFAQIVAAVFASERIDGVGPQFTQPRGFRDGFLNRFLDSNLVHAHRSVNDERGHSRVLANRPGIVDGHVDVGQNNVEGLGRLRVRRFVFRRDRHCRAHVRRKIGGRLGNQFEQAAGKEFHFTTSPNLPFYTSLESCFSKVRCGWSGLKFKVSSTQFSRSI